MDDKLMVEVLDLPLLTRSGKIVPREECWQKGWWYGAFNMWLYKLDPEPVILYQVRSPNIGWAPNKLDVIVAGTYIDGENPEQCIAEECAEELNIDDRLIEYKKIGRKLSPTVGAFDQTIRNTVVDIYIANCNFDISKFKLQKKEVYAVCEVPVSMLMDLHMDKISSFNVKAYRNDGVVYDLKITKDIFPENWDPYHFKMAKLVSNYIDKKELIPIY